jgi:hypothetical protein
LELCVGRNDGVALSRERSSLPEEHTNGFESCGGCLEWGQVRRRVGDGGNGFRLALEAAPAGSRLDGVGDEGVPFRDIAGVIGRRLDLPVTSISGEDAHAHFGFLGMLVSVDNPTSSARTQQRLGWRPVHPALIPDLEEGRYFTSEG